MFIYLLQLREALRGRVTVLFGFATYATIVWIMWAIKTTISRRYTPWLEPHSTRASVIVPVVDEPVELFTDVLERIVKQRPYEVIVVINGAQNPGLERVCEDIGVQWLWTPTPGKRNAVRMGVDEASGDVCVLVDSDTLWTKDTLAELVKPFADPRVGGVTTRQRILEPRRCFFTKWADWMENSRARYSMPMQSVIGQVGCLPGRTIAFRTSVLRRAMYAFMTEKFLGVFLEVSDDRNLTNLCLKQGYRTVYQETSLVYTDAPVKVRKLSKQQLRWARGSQYNSLRMMPWMVGHAPLLAFFFAMDMVLPFLLLGTIFAWVYRSATHTGINFTQPIIVAFPGPVGWALIGGAVVVGSTVSMWLRQYRHLVDVPRDYGWMPVYILFSTFFLMPIRILGFVRMAHAAAWGTRRNAYAGGGRRRLNPKALIPYLVAAATIGAEIVLFTWIS